MSREVLVCQGLGKRYRTNWKRKRVLAVEQLDLRVRAGEIYGFLGPNGAGKSTTIKMLVGLVAPSTGTAWLFDEPISSPKARARLGYLPENPYFHDFLTPRQLLAFHGKLAGLSRQRLAERIPRLLDLVGLEKAKDMPLRRFSKGMVQRAGIAQALLGDPDLVILDEPMSGLDPIGRKDVRDIIFRLKEEGKTVFFSSHILPDVEMICDRVGLMLHGRLREEGRLSDLLGASSRAVEVVAAGVPEPLAAKLQSEATRTVPKGDAFSFTFADGAASDAAVKELVTAGARLITVAQHRESLEQLFMRKAEESGAARPQGAVAV